MVRDTGGEAPPAPADLRIEEVDDEDGLAHAEDIIDEVFGAHAGRGRSLRVGIVDEDFRDEPARPARHAAGERDRLPVYERMGFRVVTDFPVWSRARAKAAGLRRHPPRPTDARTLVVAPDRGRDDGPIGS